MIEITRCLTVSEWLKELDISSMKDLGAHFGVSESTIKYYKGRGVHVAETKYGFRRVSEMGGRL